MSSAPYIGTHRTSPPSETWDAEFLHRMLIFTAIVFHVRVPILIVNQFAPSVLYLRCCACSPRFLFFMQTVDNRSRNISPTLKNNVAENDVKCRSLLYRTYLTIGSDGCKALSHLFYIVCTHFLGAALFSIWPNFWTVLSTFDTQSLRLSCEPPPPSIMQRNCFQPRSPPSSLVSSRGSVL